MEARQAVEAVEGREREIARRGAQLEGAAEAAAMGHFVHVFVDRATGKPAPIPDAIRSALERIKV